MRDSLSHYKGLSKNLFESNTHWCQVKMFKETKEKERSKAKSHKKNQV